MALTAEDIAARPQIWQEVCDGRYRLVYAFPEVLLSSGSYFWIHILRRRCRFMDNLLTIAADEVHVVWGYQHFCHEFENLGDLRTHLRSTPVLAHSATLAPNVLGYIHKVLLLSTPTVIYREPIGHANVTLAVVPLQAAPANSLHELDFLVDSTVEATFIIQKTFVFVDKVEDAHSIAHYLRKRLSPALRARGRDIIKVMSVAIELCTRSRNMDGLRDGSHHIFVGTEVVAMGINFPDIDIIAQWGLVDHLTLASIWQRIGRAARDPLHHAIATVFVQDRYILPEDSDAPGNEEGYYYGWRAKAVPTQQVHIEQFISRMYKSLDAPNIHCALDCIDPALIFLLNMAGCRWCAGL